MAVKFLEPGGDADFGVALWPSGLGSVAVATDFVHDGHPRSIKYAANSTDGVLGSVFVTDAGGRVSFYIYIVALPTGTQQIFNLEQASNGSIVASIALTSGGVLRLLQADAGVQMGSNGSTLSTGVWYRLCIAWKITSTTVNEFRLFKNGVQDITVSNAILTTVTSADFNLGQVGLAADLTLDFRSSDHYVDDSNALTDPGDIWVTAKRPNANGTAVEFTTQIGAAGSGYGTGHSPQVNERARSDTNGWSISTTTRKTEEYSIESASTGDIDLTGATIKDFMGWIRASVNSTANSPVHRIIVANVLTAKTMTTSSATYRQVAGSTTYPAGSTDIGMDAQYTTTAHLTRLFECGIVVAYVPASLTASVSDAITITESVSQTQVFTVSVSDSVSITENVSKTQVFTTSVSDAITVTENQSSLLTILFSTSDSIAITESQTPEKKMFVSTSDAITITENVNQTQGFNASVSDAITITENVNQTQVLNTALLSDAVTLTESVSQTQGMTTSVSDSVTITEGQTLLLIHFVSAVDSVSLTESVSQALTYLSSVFDSITITESVSQTQGFTASVSDAITITEAQTLLLVHFVSAVDAVAITESISQTQVFNTGMIVDAVTITENVSNLLIILFSVSDSVSITESTTQELNKFISISDSVSITESAILLLAKFISAIDIVTITENVAQIQVFNTGLVVDSVSLSESIVLEKNLFLSFSDTVMITENTSVLLVRELSVSDDIAIMEGVTLGRSVLFSVFDAVSINETVFLTQVFNTGTLVDAVSISENLSLLKGMSVSASDSVSVSENITTFFIVTISVSESISIAESTSSVLFFSVSVSDVITFSENLSTVKIFSPSVISDAVSISEDVELFTLRISPAPPPRYNLRGVTGDNSFILGGSSGRYTGYQVGGSVGSG